MLIALIVTPGAPSLVAQVPDDAEVEGAEPYEPGEFPRWARDLRRAEIVLFGSLPLTLLFSRLFYGFGRYAFYSIEAGQSTPEFLPPLFAPAGTGEYTADDQLRIALIAVSASSAVALLDFIIGRARPDESYP
ncbi:MAG: hypothetical protein ACLFP4_15130 [Spirochaetales bacterium]